MNYHIEVTWIFLLGVLVLMPAGGLFSYRYLMSGRPMPPKGRQFASMILTQFALLAIALATAKANYLQVVPPLPPLLWQIGLGIVVLLLMLVAAAKGWKKSSAAQKAVLRHFLPERGSQLPAWILISLMAGVAEEIAYRGVLYQLLNAYWQAWWAALVVSGVVFALAHMIQGPKAAFVIFLMAMQFHLLVFLTGTLYVSMGVHFLYDLLFGIYAMRQYQAEAAAQPLPEAQAAQA